MKKTIFSMLLAIIILPGHYAQDCTFYYPTHEGATLELTSYNKKGKVTGINEQKIIAKEEIPNGAILKIASTAKDKDGEILNEGVFSVKCENGTYSFDMNNYLSGESLKAYKDMEVTMVSDQIEVPSDPEPGDVLQGGTLELKVNMEGMQMMNMTMALSDRKVEAIENVTVPAGTFECVKISYKFQTKMMMANVKGSGIEWLSKEVGTVKSESYAQDGKLSGYTELTKLSKESF